MHGGCTTVRREIKSINQTSHSSCRDFSFNLFFTGLAVNPRVPRLKADIYVIYAVFGVTVPPNNRVTVSLLRPNEINESLIRWRFRGKRILFDKWIRETWKCSDSPFGFKRNIYIYILIYWTNNFDGYDFY